MPWIKRVEIHKCPYPATDNVAHASLWECEECGRLWRWNAGAICSFWSDVPHNRLKRWLYTAWELV